MEPQQPAALARDRHEDAQGATATMAAPEPSAGALAAAERIAEATGGGGFSRLRDRDKALSVLSVGLFVGLWWLIAAVVIADPIILPTPPAVAEEFWALATNAGNVSLWENTAASLLRVGVGWSAALVTGVAVGLVLAASGLARALIDPLLELARPVPPLAYLPLLVVWFGLGNLSKYILLWAVAFPTMVIATVAAIRGVDVGWRRAAVTLGASRWKVIRSVVLPATLPEIITAARITSALVWMTLIAAEILGATSGLGYMILRASQYLQTAQIFVGIVVISVLAFLMDQALRAIERRVAPWKGKA